MFKLKRHTFLVKTLNW